MYTIEQYSRDISDLIKYIWPYTLQTNTVRPKPVITSVGFGGKIALQIAIEYSDLISGIAPTGTSAGGDTQVNGELYHEFHELFETDAFATLVYPPQRAGLLFFLFFGFILAFFFSIFIHNFMVVFFFVCVFNAMSWNFT